MINSVSLSHLNGDVLLTVGGNGKRKKFKAVGGVVRPERAAWTQVGGEGEGDALSNAHGMTFNSLEENATDPLHSPGTERLVFFDGVTTACRPDKGDIDGVNCVADVSNAVFASREFEGPSKRAVWPVGGDKSTDASSLYVSKIRRPLMYIPETSWDAVRAPAVDDINGVQVTPPRFTLQPVGWDFWVLDERDFGSYPSGYANRFYQVHLDEPSTIVTTTADGAPGSLRQVIAQAPSDSIIGIDPALSGQTIALVNGPLVTAKRLTIDAGKLAAGLTISGNNSSRVFSILPGGTLALENVTVRDGRDTQGGGIHNEGTLRLNRVRVINNTATDSGGGIWNQGGILEILDSTIANNTSAGSGGGIKNMPATSSVTIRNSTISGNTASQGGGLVTFAGSISLTNSTVALNVAPLGSGIDVHSLISVPTLLTLTHSTIDNDVTSSAASNVVMLNSIVGALSANISARGANLVRSYTGIVSSGPLPIVTPQLMLAPLANNGGPTATMLPQVGSPAIDTGTFFPGVAATDQRGLHRGFVPDLGAVETPDLNLARLRLPGAALSPALEPTVTSYATSVSYRTASTSIGAVATTPSSIVEVSVNGGPFVPVLDAGADRELPLNVGANTLLVRTRTDDGGFSKSLTLTITRAAPSTNADLTVLGSSTMDLNPVFTAGVTAYNAGTTARREMRLWAEARESVASVRVRVNGGEYVEMPAGPVIAAGDAHSLAVGLDGTPAGWGSNLEQGTGLPVYQSMVSDSVGDAIAVAAGRSHSLVLGRTGMVTGYGSNALGQLNIPEMTGVLAIAAGGSHSLAPARHGGRTRGGVGRQLQSPVHGARGGPVRCHPDRGRPEPQPGPQGRWHCRRVGRRLLPANQWCAGRTVRCRGDCHGRQPFAGAEARRHGGALGRRARQWPRRRALDVAWRGRHRRRRWREPGAQRRRPRRHLGQCRRLRDRGGDHRHDRHCRR